MAALDLALICVNSPHLSGTKQGHKHKEFGQKPPSPDPPSKGPLTPQILYVWRSLFFSKKAYVTRRRLSEGQKNDNCFWVYSREVAEEAQKNGGGA